MAFEYKLCRGCKTDLPLTDFYRHSTSGDGFQYECKECLSVRSKARRVKNQDRESIDYPASKVCRTCLEEKVFTSFYKQSANADGLQSRCSLCVKAGIYNTTLESVSSSECAICGTNTDLVVDHDHNTGDFRGVICRPCNLALGYLKDDPNRFLAAAAYLITSERVFS